MSARSIERISMPDNDTFFREYVFKQKPVIITNLFEGEEIRQVKSMEDARNAFGNMKLEIRNEYASIAGSDQQATQSIMTFNEYWNAVRSDPSIDLCCTEYPTPAKVSSLFKLPSVCKEKTFGEEEVLSLPSKYGDYDLLSNFFMANKGNRAHLHYDGDQRQVLLYQVFGRKEVVLFDPESAINLKTLDHTIGLAFSGIYLEHMTEEQKLEFLDNTNGYYATIQPGEAVYIPMLMWHYLGYTDDGMSFNMRFGRNKYGRFLCVDNFHRDCYIQNFASKLADRIACETKYKDALASIVAEYIMPAPDMLHKVKNMRGIFKELCMQFCPDARMEEYCSPEREEGVIEEIMKDISHSVRYADPKVLAAMRPTGLISSSQKQHLEQKILQLGYPHDLLQHLLMNNTGKQDVSQLTKAEASQFMAYLKTPGAVGLD